jgi:hypothetical protein
LKATKHTKAHEQLQQNTPIDEYRKIETYPGLGNLVDADALVLLLLELCVVASLLLAPHFAPAAEKLPELLHVVALTLVCATRQQFCPSSSTTAGIGISAALPWEDGAIAETVRRNVPI